MLPVGEASKGMKQELGLAYSGNKTMKVTSCGHMQVGEKSQLLFVQKTMPFDEVIS